MSSYGACLLAASMVLGQTEGRAKQDDLTKLRAFLGTWEAPDLEILGQRGHAQVSWKQVLDSQFIEHQWMFVDGSGKTLGWGLAMFGRDPADRKVKVWSFPNAGGLLESLLVEWKGNTSVWEVLVIPAGGTKRTGKSTFALINKGSYTWEFTLEDGERGKATFKRATQKKDLWPQPTGKMPEGVSEQLRDLAWWTGGFTTEGADAFSGKTSVGQSQCGWTLDGKFLLYDLAFVESDLTVGRYRAIVGVDPSTNMTTGWEFDSTGTVGKYTVSNKGQDIAGKAVSPTAGVLDFKGRLTQTADGSEYRATGKLPKGQEVSYHGIWKKRAAGK